MASGARRVVHGSFIATGSSRDCTVVGFRPTKVTIRTSGGIEGTWTDAMADASAFKRIANGTGSFISSAGITPLATGFRLGADAALNVNNAVVYYECTD